MHILLITHYYEPDSGAAAVRLSRLAKLLHAQGHQITVLTTMPHYPAGEIDAAYRGKWSTDENRAGIRVIQVWLWTTSARSIAKRLISQISFMLMAILRGLFLPRPDIVLIENQPMFTGLAGRLLADLKGRPYVLNVSDLWPDHLLTVGAVTETSLIYRAARALVDAGYRGAQKIVVLSDGFAKRLTQQQASVAPKLITQLNGVDLQKFYPMSSDEIAPFYEKYDIDPSKRWITFMGTFATQYDFSLLLDVAQHFLGDSSIGFLYIGTGSQEETVASTIAQLGLQNIKRITWLPHDEMPMAWNVSTLSYWALRDDNLFEDIIPAKLYELLACGVPIVAAQNALSNQMIHDASAGRTVAAGDKDGVIQHIEALLADDTLRQRMRQNGRSYAEASFDPERVAKNYADILQQAM
ncbi:MAG: glycosyltransferase family 4 protein [Phototrophicaceae bacterium]